MLIEHAEATGLAIAGNRRPGSCVGSTSGWSSGKELVRLGESECEALVDSAPAVVEREPAGKQGPVRTGTAPREGKALKGESMDASGMRQGREAEGATASDRS